MLMLLIPQTTLCVAKIALQTVMSPKEYSCLMVTGKGKNSSNEIGLENEYKTSFLGSLIYREILKLWVKKTVEL